ncbi:MAG: Hsp20/alpha crystallin family protein [Bacteroidia bacterium]
MTLVKFQNRNSFPSFVDRFFNGDPFHLAEQMFGNEPMSMPAVNIRETDNSYEIALAAPGRKREDFKVEVHEQTLSISSERKQQHEEKDQQGKYTRREFGFERFERSFSLPEQIDESKISASYQDGVLQISLPKREEAQAKHPRLIDIF